MKTSEFITNNICNLEHFLEQGAYPIRFRQSEVVDLLKYQPDAFRIEGDLLHCNPKKISAKVLAAFWKFKYMEAKGDANKLYNIISEAARKADS